jgi:hypothetical protein
MTTVRTTTQTIAFARPFTVPGIAARQPAGSYVVETDEEQIETVSFLAYRRVGVRLQLSPNPAQPGVSETVAINPADFEAALAEGGGHER